MPLKIKPVNEHLASLSNTAGISNDEPPTVLPPSRFGIPSKELRISIILFVITFLTTLVAGFSLDAGFRQAAQIGHPEIFPGLSKLIGDPIKLLYGLPFSLTILTILLAHEMGHYLMCRYYGIESTLPFFIPFPSIIGTMGAFIRIKSPFLNRRTLFDVGVAGPIAGFVFLIPALIIGIRASTLVTVGSSSGIYFGEPLLFKIAAQILLSNAEAGKAINLHPIGWAAWFGILATCLNLFPIGQLDGGHITYALLGPKRHRIISLIMIFVLIALGIYAWTVPSYLFFGVILLLLGLRHPKTLNNDEPIGVRRVYVGALALLILLLSFIPIPVTIK